MGLEIPADHGLIRYTIPVYYVSGGGEWTVRRGDEKTTSYSETGSVGWMDAIALSEDHESGNTGDSKIELLWVTLKE
jgi:hypothetical protein